MNIYSDTLTGADIDRAMRNAGVYLERGRTINRPRVKRWGWVVTLGRAGSRRHFNTGTHGAGEEGAASRDDYGRFLAFLYELDPDMRAGQYDSREDFHAQTSGAYR